MLSTACINAAYPVAELYANKELTIVPVAGTPLHKLVLQTLPTGQAAENNLSVTAIADGMAIVNGAATGATTHDLDMDAMIRDISNAVGNHFSFARNVAKPVVERVLDEVTAALSQVRNPVDDFAIVLKDLPTMLKTPGFEEVIARNATGVWADPEYAFKVADNGDPEQWFNSLMTGNKDLDGLVIEFVAKAGEPTIQSAWQSFIGSQSTPNGLCEVLNTEAGLNVAVAVYLWSEHFLANPENVTGASVKSIEIVANQYRSVACQAILREYAKATSYHNGGMVLVGYNPMKKEVAVWAPTYKAWLATPGNSAEVLLGAMVSGDKPYTMAQLNEGVERYTAAWKNYAAISSTQSAVEGISVFKAALLRAINNSLSEVLPEEQSYVDSDPQWLTNVTAKLNECVEKIGSAQMKDMVGTVVDVVCYSRFFYTDSGKILKSINDIANSTAGMDIREAAYVAQYCYIADWVSEQLTVCKEVY